MTTEQPASVPTTYPSGSLYVGDLLPDVTEQIIYEAFKECGPILSVRVCRDVKDQHSLGYAYVNFQTSEHAQKALDTLNGTKLKGKPCRVMWSRRDPSQRKSNEGNLFVKGLDSTVTLVQLQDVFSQFGAIASCKVVTKDDGTSLCYGFVQFDKPEDSEKALKAYGNDKEKDAFKSLGANIVVAKFIPKHLRRNDANEKYTNIYVKNIGKKFDTPDLENLFKEFGKITSPIIMKDKEKNESRCFGFVNFEKHEDAVKAKEAMDKKLFKWKEGALLGPFVEGDNEEELKKEGIEVKALYVDRAQKKSERLTTQRYERNLHDRNTPKTNLYIKNLDDSVSEDDLRELFGKYGDVKSVKVMMTPTGVSKGFGFCDFATAEAAADAINKVQGQLFHGKPLYVNHHQRKDVRRAMLESNNRMNPTMGSMYRPQQMFPAMGGMYPVYPVPPMFPGYMRQQMYNPRQQMYNNPRSFHPRQNQGRRTGGKQTQGQMQQPQQSAIPVQMQQPQPQSQIIVQQSVPAAARPAEASAENVEKQQIGEQIYSRIMSMYEDNSLWGKLTGMLLESIPLLELQGLLASPTALNEKIQQAKDYYDKHMTEVVSQ